jgi:hypothetical protein
MYYLVVSEGNLISLEQSVNRCLNEGYRPVGGITVVAKSGGFYSYYQAMLKEDSPEKKEDSGIKCV